MALPGQPRSEGVELNFGKTGRLILPKSNIKGHRKGIGITNTDNANLINTRIESPLRDGYTDDLSFALQIHNSNNTHIKGGLLAVRSNREGADGIHGTGTCSGLTAIELETQSGDDAASLTSENSNYQNAVLEDWFFQNCSLNNYGHSVIKGLILPRMGNLTTIRRWTFKDCDLKTTLTSTGQGAPIWIVNQGGMIEDISILGGKLRVREALAGKPSGAMIYLRGVDRFTMLNTAIEHNTRTLMDAENCQDLSFKPRSVLPAVLIGAQLKPTPFLMLNSCFGSDVDITKISPSYKGQKVL